jgi:hypothetical protein
VRLRVEPRRRSAAPVEESIEFVGPPEPRAPVAVAEVPPGAKGAHPLNAAAGTYRENPLQPAPAAALGAAPRLPKVFAIPPARVKNNEGESQRVELPKETTPTGVAYAATREFQLSLPRQNTSTPAVADLLGPPPAPALATGEPVLPDFLSPTQAAPKPASIPYSGPRSGRLIWTGELGRRGVVEIEGTHASIGSLSGSLSGVPALFRVWPAEFTRDGLAVYTGDSAARGHTEPPSQSNGWNPVNFQFDPVRARELVVLEAPSRVNDFNRLVLRNDARACPIIVVDWTVQ